jgi:hypothetical protein
MTLASKEDFCYIWGYEQQELNLALRVQSKYEKDMRRRGARKMLKATETRTGGLANENSQRGEERTFKNKKSIAIITGMVAHACNLSYSRGLGGRIMSLMPAWATQ